MTARAPIRVLVAGGGVAAVEACLALHALAGSRVAVELLAPGGDFVHRPSSVLAPFSGEPVPHLPLEGLEALGVARHHGSLGLVDAGAHEIQTTDGGRLPYDRLVVATGARSVPAIHGATLFRGPLSAGAVEGALRAAEERVLFVLPPGGGWTLPAYELALLAAQAFPDGPELAVVSPEPRPLDIFGDVASEAVAGVLRAAGVAFEGETEAEAVVEGALLARGGRILRADAVVALPHIVGPGIEGLPADGEGFIPTDEHARVHDVPDVFAAGDATVGDVKHGGLAAQQADAAAEAIAAEAGALGTARPYRPVLRGVLLTGGQPLYLRHELGSDDALARTLRTTPRTSGAQLWWPPDKVAGRYLHGFVAAGARLAEMS